MNQHIDMDGSKIHNTGAKAVQAKKTKIGLVVSDKMSKTAVVRVTVLKRHPKYKKIYRVFRKFKVHNEANHYHVGDKVEIQETRPMSKDKHFIILRKIESAKGSEV